MTINTDSSGLWMVAIVLGCIFFVGSPDLVDALICNLMNTCPSFQPEQPK